MNSFWRRLTTWALPCSLVLAAVVLLGTQPARAQSECGGLTAYWFYCWESGFPGCNQIIQVDQMNQNGQDLLDPDYQVGCCGNLFAYIYMDCSECCLDAAPKAGLLPSAPPRQRVLVYADRKQDLPALPAVLERSPQEMYIRSGCTGEYRLAIVPTPST